MIFQGRGTSFLRLHYDQESQVLKCGSKTDSLQSWKEPETRKRSKTHNLPESKCLTTYWSLTPHSLEESHILMCSYFVSPSRPGLLNLSTIDIQGQIVLCLGSFPLFICIPSLYPLFQQHPPEAMTKMSLDIVKCLLKWQNYPQFRITSLDCEFLHDRAQVSSPYW